MTDGSAGAALSVMGIIVAGIVICIGVGLLIVVIVFSGAVIWSIATGEFIIVPVLEVIRFA